MRFLIDRDTLYHGDRDMVRFRSALSVLSRAARYAKELNRDRWDFAVEIDELGGLGLTRSDLRWLMLKDYARHGRETTLPGQPNRSFRHSADLLFSPQSCFVLTDEGLRWAAVLRLSKDDVARNGARQGVVGMQPASPHERVAGHSEAGSSTVNGSPAECHDVVPTWDPARHRLCVSGRIVKEYRLPSPNQQMVLTAFEEEGWPPRIDDPLPSSPGIDPKRRLQDTIKSLNRHQRTPLVRFMGDGTGEGVCWEMLQRTG
jgi:hypothetical protein